MSDEAFFPYDFDGRFSFIWWPLGCREDRDGVTLTADGRFVATFGRFTVDTPLDNVAETRVSGPYRPWTAVGIRMSMADDGATFGTTNRRGLCVCFREKIPSLFGPRDHSALTVTVADPEGLQTAIGR